MCVHVCSVFVLCVSAMYMCLMSVFVSMFVFWVVVCHFLGIYTTACVSTCVCVCDVFVCTRSCSSHLNYSLPVSFYFHLLFFCSFCLVSRMRIPVWETWRCLHWAWPACWMLVWPAATFFSLCRQVRKILTKTNCVLVKFDQVPGHIHLQRKYRY